MTPTEGTAAYDVVEVERRIAATPDTVFRFFTDPVRYCQWQGLSAELDPQPGGLFRVVMTESGDVARGEYVEVDPPRRVVFTWGWEREPGIPAGSSTVEVDLHPDGTGTLLHLKHSGLPGPRAYGIHSDGWNETLDRLATVAETGPD